MSWMGRAARLPAVLALAVSLPEAGLRIELVAPDGDPSRAVIEVRGIPAEALDSFRSRALDREQWTALFSVTVHDARDLSVPPMVGSYAVEPDAIRFKPLFGLDRGRRYRAVFRYDGDRPIEAILSLPATSALPTTIVEQVSPASADVPENLLKLYIHFSAPMRRADGLPFVRLLDESGKEVVDPFLPLGSEFWDREARRYTVFFDPGRVKQGILAHEQLGRPLRAGRRYTVAIDPAWTDAEGRSLKEPFHKDWAVGPADTTPIDLLTWTVTSPSPGSRDPLVVRFPEPLDRGLLERALGVTTEEGQSVEGSFAIGPSEMSWSFTPESPWRPGAYRLAALAILEDLAGNGIGKRFEVDLFERVEPRDEPASYAIRFSVRGGSNHP